MRAAGISYEEIRDFLRGVDSAEDADVDHNIPIFVTKHRGRWISMLADRIEGRVVLMAWCTEGLPTHFPTLAEAMHTAEETSCGCHLSRPLAACAPVEAQVLQLLSEHEQDLLARTSQAAGELDVVRVAAVNARAALTSIHHLSGSAAECDDIPHAVAKGFAEICDEAEKALTPLRRLELPALPLGS